MLPNTPQTSLSAMVESNVLPSSMQTLSWWVIDSGETVNDDNTTCTFEIPNVAWARISSNTTSRTAATPLIQNLEFVTDSKAPCF